MEANQWFVNRQNRQWFADHNIQPHIAETYSRDDVVSILNTTGSTTLISCIDLLFEPQRFVEIHNGFVEACMSSLKCKRFIPSEYLGDVERFPSIPGYYANTREIVRKNLRMSHGIEWTLFNHGWFMDYFLPQHKTYIRMVPGAIPIDVANWSICIRGSGDEPQVWTSARDAAKAMVNLLAAPKWVHYVSDCDQMRTSSALLN